MSCLCATNSLRLFVRSISQVELPTAIPQASRTQFYNTPHIRHCALNRSIRLQHSSSSGAAASTPSSNVTYPGRQDAIEIAPSVEYNIPLVSKNLLQKQLSVPDETHEHSSNTATQIAAYDDSAFVEPSPESIDALSAEIESQTKIGSKRKPLDVSNISQELQLSRNFKNAKTQKNDTIMRSISLGGPDGAGKQESSRFKLENGEKGRREEDHWATRQDPRPQREHWQIQKEALKKKFPDGWNPRKRLSPDALMGIRALHAQMPEQYTTETLAKTFQVSAEAIRRILRSKWAPDADEEADRQGRWFRRGERVWGRYAELGVKPPKKWRELGIGRGRPDKMKKPPVLVTTSARPPEAREGKAEGGSLADRIL